MPSVEAGRRRCRARGRRVSCRCSASRSTGTALEQPRRRRRHLLRLGHADRVADRDLARSPARPARRQRSATTAGSTAPWYGHPNAVETYPRVHMPLGPRAARAPARTPPATRAIVMPMLACANASDAAVNTATASAPAATRALQAAHVGHQHRVADTGPAVRSPAAPRRRRPAAAPRRGETNEVTSTTGRPASARRLDEAAPWRPWATIAASFWRPSRGPTSTTVTAALIAVARPPPAPGRRAPGRPPPRAPPRPCPPPAPTRPAPSSSPRARPAAGPAATSSPIATATRSTVPGIGACSEPPGGRHGDRLRVVGGRAGSAQPRYEGDAPPVRRSSTGPAGAERVPDIGAQPAASAGRGASSGSGGTSSGRHSRSTKSVSASPARNAGLVEQPAQEAEVRGHAQHDRRRRAPPTSARCRRRGPRRGRSASRAAGRSGRRPRRPRARRRRCARPARPGSREPLAACPVAAGSPRAGSSA